MSQSDSFVVVYIQKGDQFNYSVSFCSSQVIAEEEKRIISTKGHEVIGVYQKIG